MTGSPIPSPNEIHLTFFLPFTTMLSSLMIVSLLSTSVLAAPVAQVGKCDLSHARLHLSSHQEALKPPSAAPSYISVAIGVQNYTCNAETHKYTAVGAVAELFDISCFYGKDHFHEIQDVLYKKWLKAPESASIEAVIKNMTGNPKVLGQHYFVENPHKHSGAPATVPKWDFTSASHKGDNEAFMIGEKVEHVKAKKHHKKNVDWLSLKSVEGHLADNVYRVDTKSGQPPEHCHEGSSLQVKYAAKYWFFGGSLKHDDTKKANDTKTDTKKTNDTKTDTKPDNSTKH